MIPVFEPQITDDEISAVVDALKRGEISGSFGNTIKTFENEFAGYCGCRFGVAVNSGTSALHLAVAAAGIGEGDEVLISSCTNIATALAVIHNGAIPVPVDSEEGTWNLNSDLIQPLITERTKAIIAVHIYGHPVDMDQLNEIVEKYNLIVIEDCAEAHGALCRGRKTGSFGHMGCFSFYANKVITTGEGGMVVTNDESYAERLRLLRNLAFTEPRFFHEEAGYNFRMTGYQAAMGLAQLKKIDDIIKAKRRIAGAYLRYLDDIDGIKLPVEKEWAFNVYWMFAIEVTQKFSVSRDQLMSALSADGIQTRTFFCPMNRQPVLKKIPGFPDVACPVAERLWRTGMYLPSSLNLEDGMIAMICEKIKVIGKQQND